MTKSTKAPKSSAPIPRIASPAVGGSRTIEDLERLARERNSQSAVTKTTTTQEA